MGRWDSFSKKGKVGKDNDYRNALTDDDVKHIRSHIIGGTEEEKDKVIEKIAETYNYIRDTLQKEDTSVIDHNAVEALILMFYGEYDEFDNPPLILVSMVDIAKKHNFNVNTAKRAIQLVHKMLGSRFTHDDPSWKF